MKNSNSPYIIAEIGINFEGKLNIAKKLIKKYPSLSYNNDIKLIRI